MALFACILILTKLQEGGTSLSYVRKIDVEMSPTVCVCVPLMSYPDLRKERLCPSTDEDVWGLGSLLLGLKHSQGVEGCVY